MDLVRIYFFECSITFEVVFGTHCQLGAFFFFLLCVELYEVVGVFARILSREGSPSTGSVIFRPAATSLELTRFETGKLDILPRMIPKQPCEFILVLLLSRVASSSTLHSGD